MPGGLAAFTYRWNSFDGDPVPGDVHLDALDNKDRVECASPLFPLDDLDPPPGNPRGIPPGRVPEGIVDPIAWRARDTGHPLGEEPSEESIRQGTVRMEEHPDFYDTLDEMRAAGFNVAETTGDPYVTTIEVVDPSGNLLREERLVRLPPARGWYTARHEKGHVDQLIDRTRFPDGIPVMNRVVQHADGSQEPAEDQTGVITPWQRRVMEYHNRLTDHELFVQGDAPPERMNEATRVVDHLRGVLYRGLHSRPEVREWAAEHFPDLVEKEDRYRQATERPNWGYEALWPAGSGAGQADLPPLTPDEQRAADGDPDPSDVPSG